MIWNHPFDMHRSRPQRPEQNSHPCMFIMARFQNPIHPIVPVVVPSSVSTACSMAQGLFEKFQSYEWSDHPVFYQQCATCLGWAIVVTPASIVKKHLVHKLSGALVIVQYHQLILLRHTGICIRYTKQVDNKRKPPARAMHTLDVDSSGDYGVVMITMKVPLLLLW